MPLIWQSVLQPPAMMHPKETQDEKTQVHIREMTSLSPDSRIFPYREKSEIHYLEKSGF